LNKNKIKAFATYARTDLIKRTKTQIELIGITENFIKNNKNTEEIFSKKVYSQNEKNQITYLIEKIKLQGYNNVIEEIAYTWFNRFIALRYMEVNQTFPKIIPSYIKIFESGTNEPNIINNPAEIKECLNLDSNLVFELYENHKKEELFKYIIINLCNQLYDYMPYMFEKITDYTELLFPTNIFIDSFYTKMMSEIDIEDWKNIEIIGWMYQFYISEKKEELMNAKKAYKKEEIPAVTQLFTPKWIVKYMVENSLGKLWIESNPDTTIKENMEYYITEEKQDEEVEKALNEIKFQNIELEKIKLLDPACGSGHILVYAFDLFFEMYSEKGYTPSEISELILKNNLYGIDIDKRAAQLANFALIMKARQKSRTILEKKLTPNIIEITETNEFEEIIPLIPNTTEKEKIEYLIKKYIDAKQYGSIIEIDDKEYNSTLKIIENMETQDLFKKEKIIEFKNKYQNILKQTEILQQKYEVVVSNPPYMGNKGINTQLKKHIETHYPDSKSDLFAVFIERNMKSLKPNGFNGMITMQSWMFLSSYEKLREKIIEKNIIDTLVQLGARAFEEIGGEVVQTCTFVKRKTKIPKYIGRYIRLVDYKTSAEKEKEFYNKNNHFTSKTTDFKKIPGSPIAYWASEKVFDIFENSDTLKKYGYTGKGLDTCDKDRFERYWFETIFLHIGFSKNIIKKWFPFSKGGGFRKWYGNFLDIVNWENNGYEIRNFKNEKGKLKSRPQNIDKYFMASITWSSISSSYFGARFLENAIYGNGSALFLIDKYFIYNNLFISFLNSKVCYSFLEFLSPGLSFNAGSIAKLPIKFPKSEETKERIDTLVEQNIEISKRDWDSYETSWDFETHPLIKNKDETNKIENAFNNWKKLAEDEFNQLWRNEEELNKIFLEIYDLQDEMTPDVEEKDVTVNKADLNKDIKSFISYAVGCIVGRYSLDKTGLIIANSDDVLVKEEEKIIVKSKSDETRHIIENPTFIPNEDGIIPIYKENDEKDILNQFIKFVESAFGKENLEENLNFISKAIKNNGKNSREDIKEYFTKDFYKDHVKNYKKRPIYWLFDSGKNNAFKALMYMHRYNKDTIGKIRTDYLHEYQQMLRNKRELIELRLKGADITPREKTEIEKEIKKIDLDIKEIALYDEKIHHFADKRVEIDLDDGVKNNYDIFIDLLPKI